LLVRLIFRPLAGLAVAALVALGLGACSTSPNAATVGSVAITESELNATLKMYVASPTVAQGWEKSGEYMPASHTFTTSLVSQVLQQLVLDQVIHADLVKRHDLPTAADLAAARVLSAIEYGSAFGQFSPRYQSIQAERYASFGLITPSVPKAKVTAAYDQLKSQLWSQVCVRTVSVFKNDSSGRPDPAASQAAARSLSGQINSGESSAAPAGTGTCLGQGQLGTYTPAQQKLITTLAVGHASEPLPTGYGSSLLVVTKRTFLPFSSPGTQNVLRFVVQSSQDSSGSALDVVLGRLLSQAKVKVNPDDGTWSSVAGNVSLKPPAAPTVSYG
jgi:hypothetical protein